MASPDQSRFEQVSRRAVLKGTLGSGLLALTAAACGNVDAEVLAGSVARPAPTTQPPATTSTTTAPNESTLDQTGQPDPSREPTGPPAVVGEMVVSFTYSRVGPGKIESPYVAVWIEDAEGELLETIALFYEQTRRGLRWIDHLDRWFARDAARIATGGLDVARTISSATRPPGEYAVTWDGTASGVAVVAGEYFICIESTREDGPYSLIREPLTLAGALAPTPLPDEGELSAASVQINA